MYEMNYWFIDCDAAMGSRSRERVNSIEIYFEEHN